MVGLQRACVEGDVEVVKTLLASGASVSMGPRGPFGGRDPPLQVACVQDELEVARVLLEAGAPPDGSEESRHPTTPLRAACGNGNRELVRLLLDKGASPDLVWVNWDYTPIQMAASLKRTDIVGLLLSRGADVGSRGDSEGGDTALHISCGIADPETVRVLLDAGADASAENWKGETPLHHVAMGSSCGDDALRCAEALIDAGVHPDPTDNMHRTPLHCAVQGLWTPERERLVRILLEAGADVSKRSRGRTAFGMVCSYGDSRFVPILVRAGADVNRTIERSLKPVHLAAERGNAQLLKALVRHGASPSEPDYRGATPMHLVCGLSILRQGRMDYTPRRECFQFLLECGADADARDDYGRSPLHVAVRKGAYFLVYQLVRTPDVDLAATTRRGGDTALHIALWTRKSPDIVTQLLRAGAPLHIRNRAGRLPSESIRGSRQFHAQNTQIIEDELESRRHVFGSSLQRRCWMIARRYDLPVEKTLPPVVLAMNVRWQGQNPWSRRVIHAPRRRRRVYVVRSGQ